MKESLSKKKVIIVSLLTSLLVLAFFHHALICLGMRALLASQLPRALSWQVDFDSFQLTHRGIALNQVKIAHDFHLEIERVGLDFHLESNPFKLTKSLKVIAPKLILSSESALKELAPIKTKKKRLKLSVERGQVWKGGKCLYFSFASGEDHHLGTLKIASGKKTKKKGSLKAVLLKERDNLVADLSMHQLDLQWAIDFLGLAKNPKFKSMSTLQGSLDGSLKVQGGQDFQGKIVAHDLKVEHRGLLFEIEELIWNPSFQEAPLMQQRAPLFWQTLLGQFESSSCRLSLGAPLTKRPWLFSSLEAAVDFDENLNPSLRLNGNLVRGEINHPFGLMVSAKMAENAPCELWGEISCEQRHLASFKGAMTAAGTALFDLDTPDIPFAYFECVSDFVESDNWPSIGDFSGNVASKWQITLCDGRMRKIEITEFEGRDLAFSNQIVRSHCGIVSLKGSFDPFHILEKSDIQFSWEGGRVEAIDKEMATLLFAGHGHLAEGEIKRAVIDLDWPNTQGLLSFAGPLTHPIYQLEMTTDGSFVIPFLPESVVAKVKNQQASYSLLCHGALGCDAVAAHIDLTIVGHPLSSLKINLNWDRPDLSEKRSLLSQVRGDLKGYHIDERVYAPLIEGLSLPLVVTGGLNIEATFNERAFQGTCDFSNLHLQTELFKGALTCDQPGEFLFSYNDANLKAALDFSAWDIDLLEPSLHLDDLCGQLQLDAKMINIDSFRAHFRSSEINGKIRFEPERGFEIETDSIKGPAEDALAFMRSFALFSQWDFPLQGEIEGERGSFYLLSNFHDSFWSLNMHLKEGAWCYKGEKKLCDFDAYIQYDSRDKLLQIRNLNGDLALNDALSYKLEARMLEGRFLDKVDWDFDVRLSGVTHELIRLSGEIREAQGWELTLGPKTHWFGEAIALTQAHFDEQFKPQKLHLLTALNAGALYSQIDALSQAKLIYIDDNWLSKVEGKLGLELDWLERAFQLTATGENFKLNGVEKEIAFILKKESDDYHLNDFIFGTSLLNAHVQASDRGLAIEAIDYRGGDASLNAKWGFFDWTQKKLRLPIDDFSIKNRGLHTKFEGTLEGDLTRGFLSPHCRGLFQIEAYPLGNETLYAKSASPVELIFDRERGLILDHLNLEMSGGRAKVDRITLMREEVHVHDLGLMLEVASLNSWAELFPFDTSPQFLKEGITSKELILEGSLIATSDNIHFDGEVKTLSFNWKEWDIQIDQAEIKLDTKARDLKFEIGLLFCGVPLHLDIATRLLKGYATEISISNDLGEKLSIHGGYETNLGLQIDRFFGEFFGLGIDLLANTKINHPGVLRFTGYLHANFNHFRDILPNAWREKIDDCGLGRGYELSGDLVLFKDRLDHSYFKGFLKGRDFEIKGYCIRTLLSEVYVSSRQIELGDFCISDEAGLIAIPNIRFRRIDNVWQYNLPQIRVQDFRPSLLTDIYGQKGKLRPFLIRELLCEGLSGTVGDPQSAKGGGKLVFINTFKRGPNLLDIPIEILGRIGLDAAILIPVTGELTFDVAGGRVNFDQLLECFSEGRRSRFTLSKRKASYLDFDGQFHIDIKMKQYVLLRLTQPFTLSIRGPLENPRFSLK